MRAVFLDFGTVSHDDLDTTKLERALPGIVLFWLMMRAGLIDQSIGTAGTEGSGDVRAEHPQQESGKPVQSGS